jgi:hypothetical protein
MIYVFQRSSQLPQSSWHPAHRTSVDTFDYVERYVDTNDFEAHATATGTTAAILFRLANAVRLPADVRRVGATLEQMTNGLKLQPDEGLPINGDILQMFGEESP